MKKSARRRAALAGAAILLAALAGAVLISRKQGSLLPSILFSGTYLDRDGGLLRIFLTEDDKFRTKKRIADFPPEFVEAVLLQEDRYFYAHPGVNLASLAKAGWETYVKKTRRMGASTITMQLARLKYRIYTRSIPGKLKQIAHALYLDLFFSKQAVLEAYLNLAPCGKNIEGFPAAAWYYFNRGIDELDLSQMLMLCVIPQDPTSRAPEPNRIPEELLAARKTLFSSWLAVHPDNADLASGMDLSVDVICRFPFKTPHFTEYLETLSAPKGLEVRTTINSRLQNLCEEALKRYIGQNRSFGVTNGAVLLADSTTMEVLAGIGSADYFGDAIQGQVNGTTSKRSPGSTLKPFIYALALEQGLIHSESMLKDAPVSFSDYAPDNYASRFRGPLKAWEALVESQNVPAVALAQRLDKPDLYDFLQTAGITGLREKSHYGLSIVLGSAEVSMMELVTLYGAVANGGIRKKLKLTGENRSGEADEAADKRILSVESSFIVRKMLERNTPPYEVRPKTAAGVPIAFKTGTSIGFKDCWSIAVFDRYILCVWLGNFDGQGNNSFQGRTMAAPLLFTIADSLLFTVKPDERLLPPEQPLTVEKVPVCAVSGALPGKDCGETVDAWFIPGISPIGECRIHRKVYINRRTGYRTDGADAGDTIASVREFWPSDLLELFAKAGLPRLIPPPYPPEETRFDTSGQGFPPDIISPMDNANYVLRSIADERKSLVLLASSDADADELFWFSDSTFLGRTKPDEKLLWQPDTGNFLLSVVDSKGRSDSIRVKVTREE